MTETHWRNLTARKMPWRDRKGDPMTNSWGEPDRFGSDPLSDPARQPHWKVPGPLAAVIRLGSDDYQAWCLDGPWVVLVRASDGEVTRMSKFDYEVLVGVRERPALGECLVSVQVDGKPVPLDRCQWVLWEPCGCPEAVHLAASGSHVHAADETAAWECFYDTRRERDKARKGGWRVELMTHERYVAEVSPLMRTRCPHQAEGAA